MRVTSGYRCPIHNQSVGGGRTSRHMDGVAIDVAVSGSDAFELLACAVALGWRGVGVSQKGDSRFLHLDTRDKPALWSY